MQAITVRPGHASSVQLHDWPEPDRGDGDVLAETVAVGVCGTDRDILSGEYGEAPPGEERLVLGHESLGRVVEAPRDSGLATGDLVVGIVRRRDPVPCESCAAGEWDMCRNGLFTEHGIKQLHGFSRERFRMPAEYVVPVDRALGIRAVLLETASIVAKAWEQIDRIGSRSHWTPRRALVLGTGPVGLLAALLGVQRDLEVHILGRSTTGLKPELAGQLGAVYHTGNVMNACIDIDVLVECTGAPQLVLDAMRCVAPTAIVCLTGISSGQRVLRVDAAGLNNDLVLENNVVFGTVNANRRHYEQAAEGLARADPSWLDALITRRVRLDRWQDAYEPEPDAVKTILQFQDL